MPGYKRKTIDTIAVLAFWTTVLRIASPVAQHMAHIAAVPTTTAHMGKMAM